MLRLTLKRTMTVLALSLLLIPVLAVSPRAERTKISGTANLAYANNQVANVGDVDGHILMLGEAKGSNRNTGQADYMNGAEVSNVETADLIRGNGPDQGYITFSKNGESTVAKWSGNVTTTLSPENTPMTTFAGTWTFVKGTGQYQGIKGSGTYKGRFTSQTTSIVDWQGEYSK